MSEKENAVEKNNKIGKVKNVKKVVQSKNNGKNRTKNSTTSKNKNSESYKNSKTTNNVKKDKKNVEKNSKKVASKVSQNKNSKNSLDTKKKNERKSATIKKEENKSTKKTESKNKLTKKSEVKKEITSNQNGKELVELSKNKKIKEQTIIEKIKSFLSKIAEMQEEARKEITEIKENVKLKKEKINESKNKETISKEQTTNYLLEYYDLPYRYNETVVKILAQTPKKLFVYWDLSDSDKLKYVKSFGENFFVETYPVLLLCNEEKQYVREIAINDFANSWYIDIDNPKTKYSIQLGRKFRSRPQMVNIADLEKEHIELKTDYLPIAVSNIIEAPNDHILFENFNPLIRFRNVKTNQETIRDIRTFDKKVAKAYNLDSFYDVYKDLYKDGIEKGIFDLKNPTSGMTSSSFK